MPLLVTPRQLSQRSELYHQLGQLVAAGIELPKVLEMQRRKPISRSFHAPLTRILERLSHGATFTEAARATDGWLPPFDVALLQAGETSGRLPACLELLSGHYSERARLLRQALGSLVYPILLFHFAIFIGPIQELFLPKGSATAYLAKTFGILLPIYAATALLLYAMQGRHGERWRRFTEAVVHRIPLWGSARQSLALARLASALEALLSAGVPIARGWELAAAASGSTALQRVVSRWPAQIEDGVTPAELLDQSAEFPELFASMYHTGEVSGTLDDALSRLHTIFQEQGSRQLQNIADWMPKLVYFFVMLMIAWQVISFWLGYFNQIGEAGKW